MSSQPELPDFTVLYEFEPTEHRFKVVDGIAKIPHHPNFLLRWWPRRHIDLSERQPRPRYRSEPYKPQDLQILVNQAEEQFNLLTKCGVQMPLLGVDRVQTIADGDRVGVEGSTLFTIIRRYEGRQLTAHDAIGIPTLQAYVRYLRARTSGPLQHIPRDAIRPEQHIVTSSGPVLTDVEPIIEPFLDIEAQSVHTVFVDTALQLLQWSSEAELSKDDREVTSQHISESIDLFKANYI